MVGTALRAVRLLPRNPKAEIRKLPDLPRTRPDQRRGSYRRCTFPLNPLTPSYLYPHSAPQA